MRTQQLSPSGKLPIYMIGAGGIVNAAHLPAYTIAGYNIQGIFDINRDNASSTAKNFNIPHVFESLDEMISHLPANALIDIAVPGSATISILEKLPEGSNVLLQKPMGENYAEAKKILELTRSKKMLAAINFQLRYAPYILAARDLIETNQLGALNDIEVNVNVYTPWHLWTFLYAAPRLEILYHSIHYIDLIRKLLGEPRSIMAKSTKHPLMAGLSSVRSNIIMDYGELVRANILTNHCHHYGIPNQRSYIKIEGSGGAIIINFGALIDYPRGAADSFQYILLKEGESPQWQELKIDGSWFPHAFMGSMGELMMAAEGKTSRPDNSVEDCIHTMACVEAAYRSSELGGIRPDEILNGH